MRWILTLGGGPQRVNHAATIVGDKIYSFGGYCAGEDFENKRPMDVHVLHTDTLRWSMFLPTCELNHDAPFQRYGHTAVVFEDIIYLWGGRNDESACNKLYSFNTETLEWSCVETTGAVPGARDGHSASVIDNRMYIFGGFEDFSDRFSQDVYMLDLETFVWTFVKTRGEPPSYRDFHSSIAIGHRMYVFGGRGDLSAPNHSEIDTYCNKIVYLDVLDRTWYTPTTTGDCPIGRRSHSAFEYKGDVYIFGGFNSILDVHLNDLYRFIPNLNHWQELKPLGQPPSRRRRPACAVYGNRMFLFGGTSPREGDEALNVHAWGADHDLDLKLNDHDDLHVLEFEPKLVTLCLLAVISNKLDPSELPRELRSEIEIMTTNNVIKEGTPQKN